MEWRGEEAVNNASRNLDSYRNSGIGRRKWKRKRGGDCKWKTKVENDAENDNGSLQLLHKTFDEKFYQVDFL